VRKTKQPEGISVFKTYGMVMKVVNHRGLQNGCTSLFSCWLVRTVMQAALYTSTPPSALANMGTSGSLFAYHEWDDDLPARSCIPETRIRRRTTGIQYLNKQLFRDGYSHNPWSHCEKNIF
jgi:hypothetical protein